MERKQKGNRIENRNELEQGIEKNRVEINIEK